MNDIPSLRHSGLPDEIPAGLPRPEDIVSYGAYAGIVVWNSALSIEEIRQAGKVMAKYER